VCAEVVNEPESAILNHFMTKQYTSLSNDAMSTAEWAIANAKVDEIMDVARNKSSL
jgi:hypothetical protein